MSKRSKTPRERYVAARATAKMRSIVSEPYIKVIDRRIQYKDRRRARLQRKVIENRARFESRVLNRDVRQARNLFMQKVLTPHEYKSVHNCKREWSKLLSWRSGLGAGRKRTQRELQNNKQSFKRKDC